LIGAQRFGADDTSEFAPEEKDNFVINECLDVEAELKPRIFPQESAVSIESSTYGTVTIIKRCVALSRARLFFTLAAMLGSLITGGLIIGESITFGHLVQLLNGAVPSQQVNFYCLMFFIIAIAALLGYITSGICFGVVSEHLIFKTRDISLRTILRQDMEWFLHLGRSVSSLVSVISMDSGHLSGLSGVIIGTIISALVSVVGGAILAHIVAWKIAIVLFATSPVVILAGFFRLRVLAKLEENNQNAYIEAASLATEACGSIRTIAALGTEKETSKRFRLAVDKYREQTFRDTALGNLILAFALAIT
jgi:ABC-type bacteriocin/lantibiotic exporter with double-glycine peptidase domain